MEIPVLREMVFLVWQKNREVKKPSHCNPDLTQNSTNTLGYGPEPAEGGRLEAVSAKSDLSIGGTGLPIVS